MPSNFRLFAAFAAVCIAIAPAPARALAPVPVPPEDQPDPAFEQREPPTRWYGWQTLITDGVALGSLAGVIATYRFCWDGACDNTDAALFAATMVLSYGAGAPLVHGAHGRWGIAAASLGMRAFPILATVPLYNAGQDDTARALLFSGIGAAMAVDAAVLAREPVPESETRTMILPGVDPAMRSGSLTLVGRF